MDAKIFQKRMAKVSLFLIVCITLVGCDLRPLSEWKGWDRINQAQAVEEVTDAQIRAAVRSVVMDDGQECRVIVWDGMPVAMSCDWN